MVPDPKCNCQMCREARAKSTDEIKQLLSPLFDAMAKTSLWPPEAEAFEWDANEADAQTKREEWYRTNLSQLADPPNIVRGEE